MASITTQEWQALTRKVKTPRLLNRHLKDICTVERLATSGVKALLQGRIIEQIEKYARDRDVARYNSLKNMIENPDSIPLNPSPGVVPYGSMNSSASPVAPYIPPANGYSNAGMNAFRAAFSSNGKMVQFKSSPFYELVSQIGDTKECLTMTAHRHTVLIPLRVADHSILSRVAKDPTLRVMVFCATEGHGPQDIAFPHQSELKVNSGEIKANLRGLKNKPGSTRPVDITKELRFNIAAYSNNVEMTYALTSKASDESPQKFYLVVNVVKAISVTELVAGLQLNGKRLKKETVINDMINKSRDADIVATASVLSLKCPLSTLRITLPVRSISCRHNQCFDGESFLQLQEQGPTWLCPICNNPAPFSNLVVDEYVKDILENTSKSIDQVTIQPNGKWELHNRADSTKLKGVASMSDDDDDLVEITKSGDNLRMGTPRVTGVGPFGQITQVNSGGSLSREQSSSSMTPAPRGAASISGKRPISAVIDLTSSGDEDEEPVTKQPKRYSTSSAISTPNYQASVPTYRPLPGANNYRG